MTQSTKYSIPVSRGSRIWLKSLSRVEYTEEAGAYIVDFGTGIEASSAIKEAVKRFGAEPIK